MNPKCESCNGEGCSDCHETGEYTGEWKHIKNMREDEWPGMRAAILYAAVEAIPNNISHLPWAEFGVWRGNSARYLHRLMPRDVQLHLYDSFKGLPEDWSEDYPKGTFATAASPLRLLGDRTCIHEGWFKDTLVKGTTYGFVHIDSDLYSSAKTILERIHPVLGMIIVFDEFYQGEDDALRDSGIKYETIYETDDGQVAVKLK